MKPEPMPDLSKSAKVPTINFVQTDPGIQPWSIQIESVPLRDIANLLAADTIRMRGWPVFTSLAGKDFIVNPAWVESVTLEDRR